MSHNPTQTQDAATDALSDVAAGSIILDIFTHDSEFPQSYCSYDDGTLLVVRYMTPSGEIKVFSIGNGNLGQCTASCKSVCARLDPYRYAPGVFLFDDAKTREIMADHGDDESDGKGSATN